MGYHLPTISGMSFPTSHTASRMSRCRSSWTCSSSLAEGTGIILSGAEGVDVPSLCNFLEIHSRLSPEYDSNETDNYSLACECFYIDEDPATGDAPKLTPLA
jgi:hypothetical protein